jgi:hypothetical protein
VKFLFILLLLFAPLTGNSFSPPTGKEAKRIAKIEKDYGVHFVQAAEMTVSGKTTSFWAFLKENPDMIFLGYMFMVRENPTDRQVEDSMASAMACSCFDESILKRMLQSAAPQATPSSTPLGPQI